MISILEFTFSFVFRLISIVKIDDILVVLSGRIPTIFIWYVPTFMNFETDINPELESTDMRSFDESRGNPVYELNPEYV